MRKLKSLFTVILTLVSIITYAQNEKKTVGSLDEGTVDSQFEYVIKKSGDYQEYEVIKKTWIYKLRKNVTDSLAKEKAVINTLRAQIDTQENEISTLKTELTSTNGNLTQTTKEKDSIAFFGNLIQKGLYKTIMWGIVAILSILLLTFIYKFRNSNIVTQEARTGLSDLEEEFEQHRRKALEREQKLSRQLQDELNKKKLMKK